MPGWSHIALSYRDGEPSLYLNGKLIKTGKRTGRIVHPGLGSPDGNIRFVHFEGDMTPPALSAEALGEERIRRLAAAVPDPEAPAAAEASPGATPGLLIWQNGEDLLRDAAGRRSPVRVSELPDPAVGGGWRRVGVPPHLGAAP